MAELRLSEDGLYYWDGQRWVSTLSADGRWRWNGSAWVPVPAMPAPAHLYYQPVKPRRMPTPWTKPMQYAVAGWNLITGLFYLSLPFWMSNVVAQSIFQGYSRPNSNASPVPANVLAPATTIISAFVWISAVFAVAIATVVIIGALKRWTWMFYVVLVLSGLTILSLPGQLTGAIVGPTPQNLLPSWVQWIYVAFQIPLAAIFVWMLIAVFRYGPWATAKTTSWPVQQVPVPPEPVKPPNLPTPF